MAEMKKTAAKETAEPVEKITAKADALKIDTKEPEMTPAVKTAVKEPAEKKAPAKKAPVKKETVKKETVKKETVKKEPVKKEAVKKAPVKKTAAKPAAEKTAAEKPASAAKPAAKKAPAKTAAAKAEAKEIVTVQFAGKSYSTEDLVKIAKDVWKYDLGKNEADFKDVELYVKPEESSVYYVINGDVTGSFAI